MLYAFDQLFQYQIVMFSRNKKWQHRVQPIRPIFTRNKDSTSKQKSSTYSPLKKKKIKQIKNVQTKFQTDQDQENQYNPQQNNSKYSSDSHFESKKQEPRKQYNLSFYHCDSIAIRPNFTVNNMSKTVGFEKEEKHVFDSTESQKENKENIDSKEINIQEKLGKLKNLRGQNKKKRKSIFGSFKKSIALQELEYNRLKTTYEKGSYKYNIQYESDQIIQCCL